MRTITHLGDTVTIVAVDVTVVALCLWCSRPRAALFVAVVSMHPPTRTRMSTVAAVGPG